MAPLGLLEVSISTSDVVSLPLGNEGNWPSNFQGIAKIEDQNEERDDTTVLLVIKDDWLEKAKEKVVSNSSASSSTSNKTASMDIKATNL